MAKNRKNDIYRNEFLSHLHEQYAINDNDKSKTFVSLLTSIFVIFGTYGYVLGHYITKAPLLTSSAYDEGQILTIIWGMSNVISLILLFLSIYVIIIGYSTRRDHFVITNIREKVFGKKYEEYFNENGDLEKLKVAVLYGADAVFIGGEKISLRSRASNFTLKDISEAFSFGNSH